MPIVVQHDKLLYPKHIYNRPINPLAWRQICVISDSFAELNHMAEVVNQLSCRALPILLSSDQQHVAKSMGVIITSHENVYSTFLETGDKAAMTLVNLSQSLTSTVQIALEKFLHSGAKPTLVAGRALKIFSDNATLLDNDNIVAAADSSSFIQLLNSNHIAIKTSSLRAAYQLADLAESFLQRHSKTKLLLWDHANILAAQVDQNVMQAALWHHNTWDMREMTPTCLAVVAAMLVYTNSLNQEYCDHVSNSFYLLQKIAGEKVDRRQISSTLKKYYQAMIS